MADLSVFELADGRDLAWREFGASEGAPVIALHGSPGSHSNFAPVGDAAARAGVRLISVDRPGYGHSTFDSKRTYESFAEDIAQLAEHLGLQDFGVVGCSSGGPNAASCARFLAERVVGCAIVSGPAPPGARVSDQGANRANAISKRLQVRAPRLMGALLQAGLRQGQRNPSKSLQWLVRHLPACDARVIEQHESIRAHLLADLARPISPTTGRAAAQDICLESRPWGFELRDIARPVHVWHGQADDTVTVANGVYQAKAIPDAVLHEVPDAGHWLVYEHFSDILEGVRA